MRSAPFPRTTPRSRLTGLTVVLARAESPIVNGYFCLATEAEVNPWPHHVHNCHLLADSTAYYSTVSLMILYEY